MPNTLRMVWPPRDRDATHGCDMRIEAPIGVVASLREEGYLRPPSWAALGSTGRLIEDRPAVAVVVGDAVLDRDDLLLLPGATHLLAETVANWWGAHQWLYAQSNTGLLFPDGSEPLGGTIAQLVDRLERHCSALRYRSWRWNGGSAISDATTAIWTTDEIEVRFSIGERVAVRSRTYAGVSDQALYSFVERVACFDRPAGSEDVTVWLLHPDDAGSTLQELLACSMPTGALPRCLSLPLDCFVSTPTSWDS